MAAKESALTNSQIANLSIERLIFHVIDVNAEEDKVQPLEEITLDEDQKTFFLERIKSVASGIQYTFAEHMTQTSGPCESILENPNNFVEASLNLTHGFAGHHRKSMASGVFVVAIVKTSFSEGIPINLIFLAKFDHRNVYEIIVKERQDGAGNTVTMNKIANSLVEDKAAIQKTALISLDNDKYEWNILASERKLKANGEITDYFKNFLGGQLREVASVLTRRAVTTVQKWASALPADDIPEGEHLGNFRYRAVAYMETHEMFDTDEFIAAVLRFNEGDELNAQYTQCRESLLEALSAQDIANQVFPTRPRSLRKPERTQRWKTSEGLLMEFTGEPEDMGIETTDRDDGIRGKKITITTTQLDTQVFK